MDTTNRPAHNAAKPLTAYTASRLTATQPVSASGGRATFYVQGGLGAVVATEVSSWSVEVTPYAQHAASVKLTYTKRGCRKAQAVRYCDPSLLVVEGWGAPAPPSAYKGDSGSEASRYLSCDPRWQRDFDAVVAAAPGLKVLADYRHGGPFSRSAAEAA